MTKTKNIIEKLNTSQTVLGLDFGDKTIGIAVSDMSNTIASPIITIKRLGISKDLNELFKIIDEYNVGGLVFGYPISLNGSENSRTDKVNQFVKELKLRSKIMVELYDERFSSDAVFKELRKNKHSIKKIKKKLDQQAACYILQGFLDKIRSAA